MRITARQFAVCVVLMLPVLGACASASSFDRHYGAQRWTEAAAAFAADTALHGDPRVLYRAALMYATPGTDVHDPAMARALFERLVSAHTASPAARDPATLAIYAILIDNDNFRAAARAREAELQYRLESVGAEAATLRAELRLLEERLAEQRQESDQMRLVMERLATDLRGREEQLTEIRDELARLKAIDLQRPPARIQ